MVTSAPASAVPEITGAFVFAGDAGVDPTNTGAAGAVVSITSANGAEGGDALPSGSDDVAVSV